MTKFTYSLIALLGLLLVISAQAVAGNQNPNEGKGSDCVTITTSEADVAYSDPREQDCDPDSETCESDTSEEDASCKVVLTATITNCGKNTDSFMVKQAFYENGSETDYGELVKESPTKVFIIKPEASTTITFDIYPTDETSTTEDTSDYWVVSADAVVGSGYISTAEAYSKSCTLPE